MEVDSGKHDPLPDEYVRLISSDGFEFIIHKEQAMTSNLLKSALESGFSEAKTGTIPLLEVPGKVLEKICQYFYYKRRYDKCRTERPTFEFPTEMSIQLLMFADYMET
uniref:Elongin-C n=1 Tax=Compsopogon caeruleus TaxID=31354 RepID=A0A7S1XD39_9RHOD